MDPPGLRGLRGPRVPCGGARSLSAGAAVGGRAAGRVGGRRPGPFRLSDPVEPAQDLAAETPVVGRSFGQIGRASCRERRVGWGRMQILYMEYHDRTVRI